MSDAGNPRKTVGSQGAAENSGRDGRIVRRFRALAEAGELGLVAYITAGDPSLAASEKIVLAAAEAGADVIELGVPFSDPVADGPTIQRASERALRGGATLAGVIDLVRRVRRATKLPLAVGFGISLPEHVSVLGGIADAAVVGSALMAEIEKSATVDAAVAAVAARVRVLKQAARAGVSRRSAD
jgi:tryptophan synthase alpha subunit